MGNPELESMTTPDASATARVWGGKGPPWRQQKYEGPPLGKVLHLYVDFFSPYGYLGSLGLEEIAHHYGCKVSWHPMLLGKSYFGPTSVMKMPAVPSIPMKGPYTTRDIPRMAALMQVPLDYAGLMIPPTHTGRAFWYVHSTLGAEAATELARVMYRAHWSEGQDLGDFEQVARVGAQVLQAFRRLNCSQASNQTTQRGCSVRVYRNRLVPAC